MEYTVRIEQVPEQRISVVRGSAARANLIAGIRSLFDRFYAEFKGEGGLNIILYSACDAVGQLGIACGVQVKEGGNAFSPGGTVAATTYMGPYDQMQPAHAAIHSWVRDNSRQLAGPSWEVYGHWNDDPAKLRTDIFYLLV